jgi:hypothetical protein
MAIVSGLVGLVLAMILETTLMIIREQKMEEKNANAPNPGDAPNHDVDTKPPPSNTADPVTLNTDPEWSKVSVPSQPPSLEAR